MTIEQIIGTVKQLPRKDQINLVQELWQIVNPENSELRMTPAQIADLDRRIDELERNPEAVRPWSEVKKEIEVELRGVKR